MGDFDMLLCDEEHAQILVDAMYCSIAMMDSEFDIENFLAGGERHEHDQDILNYVFDAMSAMANNLPRALPLQYGFCYQVGQCCASVKTNAINRGIANWDTILVSYVDEEGDFIDIASVTREQLNDAIIDDLENTL